MFNLKSITKQKLHTKLILISLIIISFKTINGSYLNEDTGDRPVTFQFPEYDYKENNKNELAYHDMESTCEQTENCAGYPDGFQKVQCIRKCISMSCFTEIYDFDQLEAGEIDVRLNSFKGCFIQRLTKPTIL